MFCDFYRKFLLIAKPRSPEKTENNSGINGEIGVEGVEDDGEDMLIK